VHPDVQVITFFVPGRPQAQGSKVKTRWGMREDNTELGPWRERVALAAHEAQGKVANRTLEEGGFQPLLKGPIAVGMEFILYRPQATPQSRTPPATKKPDIDKMARAILDALTHVLWTDDSQVTMLMAVKRVANRGEGPGVHVWVSESQT
jgi:crossover junction endodeoxyribonuclease RusA